MYSWANVAARTEVVGIRVGVIDRSIGCLVDEPYGTGLRSDYTDPYTAVYRTTTSLLRMWSLGWQAFLYHGRGGFALSHVTRLVATSGVYRTAA